MTVAASEVITPHTVLMGDPGYFSVQGGANPHTRTQWGFRKRVDTARAIEQWKSMKELLEDRDVRVWVVPPQENWPGMVFPANAGFMKNRENPNLPLDEKPFYLSNMIPSRAGEAEYFREFLLERGVICHTVPKRFEGEADLIETAEGHLFTSGPIIKQRFIPRLGLPPWRRLYGFRSDEALLPELLDGWKLENVIPLRLVNEAYYHGDTVLCPFGPRKDYVIVYRDGLTEESFERLQSFFGRDYCIEISDGDAEIYAANSFQFHAHDQCVLVMPEGVSKDLRSRIEDYGVEVITIDVSEFLKKGGGSVKCMIGDLGRWRETKGEQDDIK